MKKKIREFAVEQWKQWRWFVCLVVFVIIPVKSSLADWNWVPTGSMNPTIMEGDMVYVNKLAYDLRVPLTFIRLARWNDPERGDMVVCFSPEDGRRLVKRVIGVPGDELEMTDNVLTINGTTLSYEELPGSTGRHLPAELRMASRYQMESLPGDPHVTMRIPGLDFGQGSFGKLEVPEGQYFLMGDNRDNSHDSRMFGFMKRDSIIGEATSVIVSFNKKERWRPRWRRFFTSMK